MTAPGMATHQAAYRQDRASTSTVDPNGLIGVGRTRGQVAASGGSAHPVLLVDADDREGHPGWDTQRPHLVLGRDRTRLDDRGASATHPPPAVSPVTAPAPVSPIAARRAWIIDFLNSL
jgi:hypothetical protein